MSTFHDMFKEVGAPALVELLGETVVFDSGVGPKRSIRMELIRNVQQVDVVGTPVYVTIGKCHPSRTSIEDNGHGGIDPTEVEYGRSKVEFALRTGAAARTTKLIRKIADDGDGMLALEIS